MEEKTLVRKLSRLRPASALTGGPLVSIVVTNRDGEVHLRRLLNGLSKSTAYRAFEVVLVDNGSTDASLSVFDGWDGPKLLVANENNQSFSQANNQGVLAATGDLVLLLNNDIEPIHEHWLGFMVESMTDDVAAVGAMLVYPKRPKGPIPPAHPDLTVQHLGSYFEHSTWGVRAVNAGSGTDPTGVARPVVREVPAVTAACLLARRTDLLATPLDETYWYGSEDWDLCLRLAGLGRVVVDERAVLLHHEFGTQDKYVSEAWLEARTRNHQWFNELWGPGLIRKLRAEVTGPKSEWFFRGGRIPKVCVVAGPDQRTQELAGRVREQALEAGWRVSEEEGGWCDVAIAFAPPADPHWFTKLDISIAVVTDREKDWARTGNLDGAKHVIVPDHVVGARVGAVWGHGIAEIHEWLDDDNSALNARLLETTKPRSEAMRIGVSTCAPDWPRAQFWGDTHLARALMRAFRRLGHETTELIVPDWRGVTATSCDAVVHLRGLERRPVGRGQWNLLWIISHPDRLQAGEADDYDIIASASQRHADRLTQELGRQVHFLPQATDADTFDIGPRDVDFEGSVLYVGNARRPHRRAPRWMMRNQRPFHLYGKSWEKFPESEYVRGEYISNQDLASAYRSASVVVADHHGSMRTNGFVANRLFDVLASGGVVLSDEVVGLPELFGDLVPTYANARELESQLRGLLADVALRRRLATDGRSVVMAEHTVDHRARKLLQWLDEL